MAVEKFPPRRPVILIIMDGIGVNPSKINNAVELAATPNLDRIYSSHSTCLLEASGRAVGLPDGQMGNSEVGHLTLGAGSVLKQDLVKISDAVEDGSLFSNPVLCDAVKRAEAKNRPIHLLGLVSDGGVHSHINHLLALIELCKKLGARPQVHMITDGRDTAPACAEKYLAPLQKALTDTGGSIGTITGRFFAMDRDKRWERIEAAWKAIACGEGKRATSASAALQAARSAGETDEFITPTVLDSHVKSKADDEFIFFNFRNDRPRELSESLAFEQFEGFDRAGYSPIVLTTMTRYKSTYPFSFAFTKDAASTTLGKVVSDAGISQLRSAETEKYPHVTFFFNSGQDEPLKEEHRLMVDSPKVDTYDLQPEMSAEAVTSGIERALDTQLHGLIVVNLANGDMVGHTGVRDAVVRAVEVVDEMVGRLWDRAVKNGYSIVLTADHGNADMLVDPITGEVHTQHTTFPVACVIHDKLSWHLGNGHGLPSVAPTILQLMGLPQPSSMQGRSMLVAEY